MPEMVANLLREARRAGEHLTMAAAIHITAKHHGVPPALVEAVCERRVSDATLARLYPGMSA